MTEKKIDEAWKAKIQAEKKKLQETSKDSSFPVSSALESAVFLSIFQDIGQKIGGALSQGADTAAKKMALAFYVLEHKTKEAQTEKEQAVITQFKMELENAGLTLENILKKNITS